MIKIVEINNLSDLRIISKEWNSLLNELTSTPFQTYEWITNYIKYFLPKKELLLLLAYSDDELVGIAPLLKISQKKWGLFPQKKIIFLDEVFSEYCDLIINPSFIEEVLEAFINYIFANHPDIYCIDLRDIALESKTGIALQKMNNILLSNFKSEKYLYINTSTSYQKYLSSFSNKTLLTIKNKEDKIRDINVKYIYAEKAEENHIELLSKLNKERIEKKGKTSFFSSETNYKFLRALLKDFNENNITHLSYCICKDEIVSFYLCFHYFNKLYFFISGFNRRYENYSLGSIHLFKLIEYCFKNNIAKFDFLRGGDKYKYRYHPEECFAKRSIIWKKSFMGRIQKSIFYILNYKRAI
jgi:CelD/BcsL family acetyltransferase involved in cellulose biosynthesis